MRASSATPADAKSRLRSWAALSSICRIAIALTVILMMPNSGVRPQMLGVRATSCSSEINLECLSALFPSIVFDAAWSVA